MEKDLLLTTSIHPTIEYAEHIPEASEISAGLDYYKLTMAQHAYEQEPNAEVTFTFKNRGEQRLMDYVDPAELQARLDHKRKVGWEPSELDYFASLTNSQGERIFTDDFLGHLRENSLPEVSVTHDPDINDLAIETTGDWSLATFWETIVMSEVNEIYFEQFMLANGIDPFTVYDEGNRRLDAKIAILKENPDIKIVDFGTRRHFSFRWQKHVLERLKAECPENLIGTSNIALAHAEGLKPTGTFAHEMPMVYAGLARARGYDVRASHNQFLESWYGRYGEDYSIVLTDTFGTNFFFEDFTPEQAGKWRGVRHDSGDPFEFGERAIGFYEQNGIPAEEKIANFSDGLDIDLIVELHNRFKGRLNDIFGWGTTLMNDLNVPARNIVMKATHVRDKKTDQEADLVKISDNTGKHTGPEAEIDLYKYKIFATSS